jgi:hypothetical protein
MRFKMENRRLSWWKPLCLILLLVVILPLKVDAREDIEQQSDIIVRGIVSGESGEALVGVSVTVKGTTTGTFTGLDGDYEIKVPSQGGTLVFSYIGFTTKEVKVSGETSLNVTLTEESELLSEVVVVGYGVSNSGRKKLKNK